MDKRFQLFSYGYDMYLKTLGPRNFIQIGRYFYNRCVKGELVPLSAVFYLTYRCQCSCGICIIGRSLNDSSCEIDTESSKEILRKVASTGCINVTLSGGEPLLREDLVELVRFNSDVGLRTSLDTNGLLLTYDMINRLRRAGIGSISISLDSHQAKVHDARRGVPGCFEKAVQAMRDCRKQKINCFASVALSEHLLDGDALNGLIDLSLGAGARGVKILLPVLFHQGSCYALQEGEKAKLKEILKRPRVFFESPLAWNEDKGRSAYCPAVRHDLITINPRGHLRFCPAFPILFDKVSTTNLRKSLDEMWKDEAFSGRYTGRLCHNSKFQEDYSHRMSWGSE